MYFEEVVGEDGDAKPLIEVYSDMMKADPSEEILRKLIIAMENLKFSNEQLESSIIIRLTNRSTPEMRSLKDAQPSSNDFKRDGRRGPPK